MIGGAVVLGIAITLANWWPQADWLLHPPVDSRFYAPSPLAAFAPSTRTYDMRALIVCVSNVNTAPTFNWASPPPQTIGPPEPAPMPLFFRLRYLEFIEPAVPYTREYLTREDCVDSIIEEVEHALPLGRHSVQELNGQLIVTTTFAGHVTVEQTLTRIAYKIALWRLFIYGGIGVMLPLVALAATTSLAVGTALKRRAMRAGHCHHCGYDLRASPDRCPECGQSSIPHARSSKPNVHLTKGLAAAATLD
ncbi:MAG: hypothetical protein QM770_08730 [Tepidisphaeraceae bacterium]